MLVVSRKFSPSKISLIHRPSKGEEGLGTRLGDALSIHGANITAHHIKCIRIMSMVLHVEH